jgi:hypothetical protein
METAGIDDAAAAGAQTVGGCRARPFDGRATNRAGSAAVLPPGVVDMTGHRAMRCRSSREGNPLEVKVGGAARDDDLAVTRRTQPGSVERSPSRLV